MVFAEAEATNTVTDELAVRTSLRECEQESQKIELWERDKEPAPLKTVIPATSLRRPMKRKSFSLTLGSEIGKSGEGSGLALEVSEESLGPTEKHEFPSLLDLKLESEEAANTAEIAVVPSAPAEPEENVLQLTFAYGGRPSRTNCVIDRSQVRRQPGDSGNIK